jgi:hypothetical protein
MPSGISDRKSRNPAGNPSARPCARTNSRATVSSSAPPPPESAPAIPITFPSGSRNARFPAETCTSARTASSISRCSASERVAFCEGPGGQPVGMPIGGNVGSGGSSPGGICAAAGALSDASTAIAMTILLWFKAFLLSDRRREQVAFLALTAEQRRVFPLSCGRR